MAQIRDMFLRFRTQFSTFWAEQSSIRKVAIVGGIGSLLAAIALFAITRQGDPYRYLFVDISQEDSMSIISFLKAQGYSDFSVDAKGIKVKQKDLGQLRIKLSQEGLPTEGQIGWEKFDSQDFARTEFDQNINKIRAMQGELSRTIKSIDGIQSARVHIVVPPKSLFIEDKKDPTAAIYIKQKRGQELDRKQVRGIQHLVSRSVEGLRPNNVTIINAAGKMLTEIEDENEAGQISNRRLSYRKTLEKNLEAKISEIVGRIVGPDRVVAKVDAEVDFTQEKQHITDIDPERFAVTSKNTTGMSMEGSGLNPTGIPGTKSNVPGEQEAINPSTASTENKRDTELVNYEVGKKISSKTLDVGDIIQLSVAVIVDGIQEYPIDGSRPQFEARPDEEMQKIEQLVKAAVGFKADRDKVTVHNMMFQLDPSQMQVITEKKKENKEYITTLIVSAAVSLALVLFFAFIVRPYFRWLSYDPNRKKAEALVEEFKPDLDLGAIQDVQVQEEVPFEKLSPKEQVLYLARHEPKRTTEALRIMLSPHQGTS